MGASGSSIDTSFLDKEWIVLHYDMNIKSIPYKTSDVLLFYLTNLTQKNDVQKKDDQKNDHQKNDDIHKFRFYNPIVTIKVEKNKFFYFPLKTNYNITTEDSKIQIKLPKMMSNQVLEKTNNSKNIIQWRIDSTNEAYQNLKIFWILKSFYDSELKNKIEPLLKERFKSINMSNDKFFQDLLPILETPSLLDYDADSTQDNPVKNNSGGKLLRNTYKTRNKIKNKTKKSYLK